MSPCIGCKYFGVCGDLKRTKPCSGRVESKRNGKVQIRRRPIEVTEEYLKKQEELRIRSEAAEEESHKRLDLIHR